MPSSPSPAQSASTLGESILPATPASSASAGLTAVTDVEAAPVEASPAEEIPGRISYGARAAALTGILLPFIGLVVAICLVWGWGFGLVHLFLLLGMYVVTALGVTVGYHRLFTHRSFETTRVVKFLLAVAGSMAMEGPVLKWVAMHRRHHQHSDHENDPHSPHHHGDGVRGVLTGMWHAHVGWIFQRDPANLSRYVADLLPDRLIRAVSSTWIVWTVVGLLIPTFLGGLITMSWRGMLLGFLWGGLVRVFLVHHMTWSINSICHMWGTRPFRSHDESRNNFVFGLLGFGEGWHNNHHAFPTSARHGLRWWEFDLSYWIIRALALVGLAWKVRLPSPQTVSAKRQGGKRQERGAGSEESGAKI